MQTTYAQMTGKMSIETNSRTGSIEVIKHLSPDEHLARLISALAIPRPVSFSLKTSQPKPWDGGEL